MDDSMSLNKKVLIMLIMFSFLMLYFSLPVHAGIGDIFNYFYDPIGTFKEGMMSWLTDIATSLASAAFDFLGEYVIGITDMSKIPQLDLLVSWSKMGAQSLLAFFILKELFLGLIAHLKQEEYGNPVKVIMNGIFAAALVEATPYFIQNMLIPLNNSVVESIATLGITVDFASVPIMDQLLLSGGITEAGLQMLFLLLVWAITFMVFTIAGAIRYVDLAIALIIGPLIATTYVKDGEAYRNYFLELVTIIFTQSFHMLIAYFILQWSSEGSLLGIVLAIAGTTVAIRGPQALRQYIYSSGASSAIGNLAGKVTTMAAFRMAK